MPSNLLVYRCLIISPSDVEDARQQINRSCQLWSAQVGAAHQARIEAVAWECHAVPELGGHPQKLFNPEVDSCDLAIAVFWSRLGSPTDTHDSGSIEEIERMLQAGKPVLVYFSEAAIPQRLIDPPQFERLKAFKKDLRSRGIVDSFTAVPELGTKVVLHLTNVLVKLLMRDRQGGTVMSGALTAPTPDIRLSVSGGQVILVGGGVRGTPSAEVVTVEVMNHSPIDLHLAQIAMEMDDGNSLTIPIDVLGRTASQVVGPGKSFQFRWDRDVLKQELRGRKLRHAVAIDEVNRIWRSPAGEAEKAVAGDLPVVTLRS